MLHTIFLVLLLSTPAILQRWDSNDDCPNGNRCQQIQECDDYGCQEPWFECVPGNDFSTASAIDSAQASDEPETPTRVQTNNKIDDIVPETTTTGAQGDNRPSRLTVRTQNTNPSVVRFDSTLNPNSVFEWGLDPSTGQLTLANLYHPIMRVSQDGNLVDMSDDVTIQAYHLEVENLWSFRDTQLSYNGVPQWKMIYDEIFMVGQPAEGWSLPEATSKCGALSLLGGYCRTSTQTLTKSYSGLPQHTRVRVQANFHFIDSWAGDTAYMKVTETQDMSALSYAWTDSFDYVSTRNSINVWGRDIGEGKFNQLIDFEMLHTFETVKVMFGTSLDQDSWSASYGISSIRIFVI